MALRRGASRRAVKVFSFCQRPSSCKGGLTSMGNRAFSGVIGFPVWFLLTMGLTKTILNDTFSGTVPVGAKLLTPPVAAIAEAGIARSISNTKNLRGLSKINPTSFHNYKVHALLYAIIWKSW